MPTTAPVISVDVVRITGKGVPQSQPGAFAEVTVTVATEHDPRARLR